MVEKKKSNIEIYHEKKKAEKLIEKKIEPVIEVKAEPVKKQEAGNVLCVRCKKVFVESQAKFIPLFGEKGCPNCGFPVSKSKI
jgi:hypothetical protein